MKNGHLSIPEIGRRILFIEAVAIHRVAIQGARRGNCLESFAIETVETDTPVPVVTPKLERSWNACCKRDGIGNRLSK